VRQRPDGASDQLVEAVGKASEAYEYLVRARGHLYSFHQLMGHVDLMFSDVAARFDEAGLADVAARMREEVVGRNALDGRWSFQVVEEFDDLYFGPVEAEVRRLEADHMDGQRHIYESEMKDHRITRGRPGHERRPPSSHDQRVETDEV
jgi:hypothetical protein